MTDHGPAPRAEERIVGERDRGRPRWGWFALFGVNVLVHLPDGWDTTDTIGASLGLVVTLGLVFFPALRRNRLFRMTMTRVPSADPDRLRRRKVRLTWAACGWSALPVFLLYVTIFESPPRGMDILFAVFVVAASLVPMLVVLVRRWQEMRWLRLLEAGPLTRIAAVVEEAEYHEADYDDGDDRRFVHGWAVLPDGLRTTFSIEECPQDLYAEIRATRTVWVVGEPRLGEVALGVPDRRLFAMASFAAKRRDERRLRARFRAAGGPENTSAPGQPAVQPFSSTPPGIGAVGSYGVRVKMKVARSRWFGVPSDARPTRRVSPA